MPKSKYAIWQNVVIDRDKQHKLNGHKSLVLWFTGLSGSGKSTLAHSVAEKLYQKSCHVAVLDGDNVRHGLCDDLGFSIKDRTENIRRIGEVCKLFVETGLITFTAFISPFESDREKVKSMFNRNDFIEIYVKCGLQVCESRDVKGIYKKARTGEIKNFTGINSSYEEPTNPDIIVDTEKQSLKESEETILHYLYDKGIFEI